MGELNGAAQTVEAAASTLEKVVESGKAAGVGSVVRLRSGGAQMTIVAIDASKVVVQVVWTSDDGKMQAATLPAVALMSA
jgi:uncharacterized protein YodC (DUF2158 family)